MTIDGQLLRGIFEHERLKPAVIKTNKVNVTTLPALKRIMNSEITPPASGKPLYLFISGPITTN